MVAKITFSVKEIETENNALARIYLWLHYSNFNQTFQNKNFRCDFRQQRISENG